MSETVHLERREQTWILTVDRTSTRNAVDPAVHAALAEAVDRVERGIPHEARALILTGAGDSFLSGGDLKYIREHPFEETLPLSLRMNELLGRVERLPILVLAAVNGYAYGGGCEIMLACDLRVAEQRAKLSFRQAAMGLTTGWGAATRLSELVPRGTALRLLSTAEVLDAGEAARVGLVDEVVEDGGALDRCLELAGRVQEQSPRAVAAFKEVLRAAYGKDAASSRALEWEVFERLWGESDHAEALAAFFEKRPPRWS